MQCKNMQWPKSSWVSVYVCVYVRARVVCVFFTGRLISFVAPFAAAVGGALALHWTAFLTTLLLPAPAAALVAREVAGEP